MTARDALLYGIDLGWCGCTLFWLVGNLIFGALDQRRRRRARTTETPTP